MTITIKDESLSGTMLNEMQLIFESTTVTVEDIIRSRVAQEVEKYNAKHEQYTFNGLVKPSENEIVLNGVRQKNVIDVEKQIYVALNAFQNNAFFLLVDNKQCSDLNELVPLTSHTTISFIKLTQLVGG
jgi:hypothetical protein